MRNLIKMSFGAKVFRDSTDKGVSMFPTIKEMVQYDAQVNFQYYRDGQLWYKTEVGGFMFPVPIIDIGNATFLNQDRAILFMRYIRKYRKELDE